MLKLGPKWVRVCVQDTRRTEIMNGILDKLQNVLVPFSQKVNENKVLKGISKGFASMLPIVMVGAIFTLLASLNISVYQNFITSTGLKGVLSIPAAFYFRHDLCICSIPHCPGGS